MVDYKKHNEEIFSGINIVPFTDIILVLLVVFMIAAPGIISSGLDINLPGASSARSQPKERHQIDLTPGGRIYLAGSEVSMEGLSIRVKELAGENPDSTFVVNADTTALHGRVVKVLDLIRAAGARKIYIGTVRP